MLSALPSYFCRSFGRFLPLLGEGGDLGTHILRVQCHDVLRVFGLQQLLCKFKRRGDIPLGEIHRKFAHFLCAVTA